MSEKESQIFKPDAAVESQPEQKKESREQWLDSAKQAIKAQGLEIDLGVPSYKTFTGEEERFFIQKCTDKEGKEVVVKVSSPDKEAREALERERAMYDLVQKLVTQLERDSKERLQIRFPQKLGEFNYAGQKGIIRSYIKLCHGDIHGGNIAYSRDKETGKAIITLIDLEMLKVDENGQCPGAVALL